MPSLENTFTNPSETMIKKGWEFGEWLRAAMKARGWRNKEVANASGVSLSYVALLSRGGVNSDGIYQRPSIEIVQQLADALGADEDQGREAAGWPRRRQPDPTDVALPMGGKVTFACTQTGRTVTLTMTHEVWNMWEMLEELQNFRTSALKNE